MDEKDETREALSRSFSGLLEGFSQHAQAANRAWLLLAVVSVLGITQAAEPSVKMKLPVFEGEVSTDWFCVVTALVCSALFVAWTTSLVQCDRIRVEAQRVIDDMRSENDSAPTRPLTTVDPQFLWDAQRRAGTLAVASVPLALGRGWTVARGAYYGFLKLFAVVVHFGLPVLAVWVLLTSWRNGGSQSFWQCAGASAAAATMLLQMSIVLVLQARYWGRVYRPVALGYRAPGGPKC